MVRHAGAENPDSIWEISKEDAITHPSYPLSLIKNDRSRFVADRQMAAKTRMAHQAEAKSNKHTRQVKWLKQNGWEKVVAWQAGIKGKVPVQP